MKHITRSLHFYSCLFFLLLGLPLICISSSTCAEITRAKVWVWANNPSAESYTPNLNYQYNSAGKAIEIKHDPGFPGRYSVYIPGLAFTQVPDRNNGTVHVSAYGGNHQCKPAGWGNVSQNYFYIKVICFKANSNMYQDGQFTLLYYKEDREKGEWKSGYVNVHNSNLFFSSYIPDQSRQWNSMGRENWIRRITEGQYHIIMPGLDKEGGIVMVSAFGENSDRCSIAAWSLESSNTFIQVNCFAFGGTPTDTFFNVSYMTDVAMGIQKSTEVQSGGYVWANNSVLPAYIPSVLHQKNTATSSANVAGKINLGHYNIHFPSLAASNTTTVQVSAYDLSSNYCNIDSWFTDHKGGTNLRVKCFNSSGYPVDNKFTAAYLTQLSK